MFASRRRDRQSAHLMWRVRLFSAGAFTALAGIYLDMGWLVNVALGILILGFLVRFLPTADADDDEASEDRPDDEALPDAADGDEGSRSAI